MSRGDAQRLPEWVAHHRALGFEEFHMVLDHPTDNSAEVLRGLGPGIIVDERGAHGEYYDGLSPDQRAERIRSWQEANKNGVQDWATPMCDGIAMRQYMVLPGVLNKYAMQGDCWVSVIDVDEFLVIPGQKIQDITRDALKPRLRFYNFNFDTSGWTPGESVRQTCTSRWARVDIEAYGGGWEHRHKSVVESGCLFPFATVHAISKGPFSWLDPTVGKLHHYRAPDQGLPIPYRIIDTTAMN